MKGCLRVMMFGVAALSLQALAQMPPVDPSDGKFGVYALKNEEATAANAGFASGADVPAFWNTWDGRDYIYMTTANNAYTATTWNGQKRDKFTGPDDAQLTVKAGCTENGVYMYFLIADNVWIDGKTDETIDAVDMFVDNKTAADIAKVPAADMAASYGAALTKTVEQFQVNIGASKLQDSLRFTYYDDLFGALLTKPANIQSFDDMSSSFGIVMKFWNQVGDAQHRAMMWFLPWAYVGHAGIDPGYTTGKEFSMSGGYNDRDATTEDEKSIRWLRQDPWVGPTVTESSKYWGQGFLEKWESSVAAPVPGPVGTKIHLRTATRVNAGAIRTEYFTPNGQRVSAAVAAKMQGTMVIKRQVLANGSVQVDKGFSAR